MPELELSSSDVVASVPVEVSPVASIVVVPPSLPWADVTVLPIDVLVAEPIVPSLVESLTVVPSPLEHADGSMSTASKHAKSSRRCESMGVFYSHCAVVGPMRELPRNRARIALGRGRAQSLATLSSLARSRIVTDSAPRRAKRRSRDGLAECFFFAFS